MASDLAMRQKIAEALQPFANADELPRLARTLPGIVSNVLEEGLHCRAGMDAALEARRRIFDRAASERLLVLGFHYPFPGLGRMLKTDGGYAWIPAQWQF